MLNYRALVVLVAFSFVHAGLIAQTFEWAVVPMGALTRGFACVTDESGNVYMSGHVNGPTDMDPGPGEAFTSGESQNANIFLVKYGPSGNYIWHVEIPGTTVEMPSDLCLDHQGGLLMTGFLSGITEWGQEPNAAAVVTNGFNDGFVAKFDTTGAFQWVRQLGAGLVDEATGVAVDDADNVYVTGYFGSTVDFDPGPGVSSLEFQGGVQDSYLAKYSPNGDLFWVRGLQGSGAQTAQAVACDDAGAVYVTGQFAGATSLGPGTSGVVSGAGGEGFLCKYSVDGDFVWARSFGGPLNEKTDVVLADGAGHLYLFGRFGGTADLDPGPAVSTHTSIGAEYAAFYTKLDTSGHAIWVRTLQANTLEAGSGDIAVDGEENVYVTGNFNTLIDLDPGVGEFLVSAPYPNDHFLVKFDSTGTFRWGQTIITGDVFDTADALCTDSEGNVFVSGSFSDSIAFDASGLEGSFVADIVRAGYLAKYGGDLITGIPVTFEPAFVLEVFPNPATDALTVLLPADRLADRLEILDASGRLVWLSTGPVVTTVPAHLFAPGTYTVAVRAGGLWSQTRFVIGR